MVGYVNNTGSTISGVTLAFDYERYRLNTAAASITFFYSTDGSTWISVSAGDSGAYTTGASSYGYPLNTINKTGVNITGLNIPNTSGKIYFRWNFSTVGANSQGLGLDNFSMAATLATSVPTLITPTATSIGTGTATLGATVSSDGGASLTSRGTVWGTAAAPTGNLLAEGGTAVSVFSHARSGFSVNTLYTYRGYAINSSGAGYSPDGTFWTLANTPNAPTVGNPSAGSLDVSITAGDGNPSSTLYAIKESGGNYVQTGGALGSLPAYQTASTWGTKTVTGLIGSTTYGFSVVATNGAGVQTSFSTTNSGTTSAGGSAPSISSITPLTLATNYGSTAVFTVSVSGTPPLTNFWYKISGGTTNLISVATNAPLTLSSVTLSDTASYQVVVSNLLGTATSAVVTLTVADPYIVTQPVSFTNLYSASGSFTVSAAGSGSQTYQWQTNGVNIVNGGRFSGATSATLGISGLTLADTNWIYTAVVSGAGLPVTSSTVTVSITNAAALYRTKASGNWSDLGTWQESLDSGTTWVDAISTPTSSDFAIEILNGHLVTNTASVTVDQVTIDNGGQLTLTTAFTVNNGSADDIVVQNGGVFQLGAGPTFSSGATARINTGGILRVAATGLTGNGAGVNAATFVYDDASILEYAITSTFSASGVTYFPNVNASTIPIFRVSATPGSVGGGSATVINGALEVTSGNTVTWTAAGTKTFRNGIRGAGNVAQGAAGQFIISGTIADVGGAGTLSLGSAGLLIGSGCVATLSSDKTLIGTGVMTVAGTLDLNSHTLTTAVAPVLSGTTATEVDRNGGSPLVGKVVLTPAGTLTYGGTLTVAKLGATLQSGDSFTLFTAPAFSAWFSTVNLPTLAAGLIWDTNKLATNGVLEAYSFTTNAFQTMTTASNVPGQLLIAKVLTKTAGGRGAVSLKSATGASHGTLSTNSTIITYTPTTDYLGSDAFDCVVQDVNGGLVTVRVLVTVTDPSNPTLSGNGSNLAIRSLGGNTMRIFVLGTPSTSYQLQYSDDLSTWANFVPAFAMPGAGVTNFDDTSGISPRYYRTILP